MEICDELIGDLRRRHREGQQIVQPPLKESLPVWKKEHDADGHHSIGDRS